MLIKNDVVNKLQLETTVDDSFEDENKTKTQENNYEENYSESEIYVCANAKNVYFCNKKK